MPAAHFMRGELLPEGLQIVEQRLLGASPQLLGGRHVHSAEAVPLGGQHYIVALHMMPKISTLKALGAKATGPGLYWVLDCTGSCRAGATSTLDKNCSWTVGAAYSPCSISPLF